MYFSTCKKFFCVYAFLTSWAAYGLDLDFFGGSGNISARTAYERAEFGTGGSDKVWTPFTAYDSSANLGLRFLQTYDSPNLQIGAEFSYFTASTSLPADRIVERSELSRLTLQGRQAMTDSDRIRFDTGRASFSFGFSVPLLPPSILGEFGLLAGAGVGRVRDAVILQTNGRDFTSYPSMSLHWGLSLRIRFLLTDILTAGIEYRYTEEFGKNLGSSLGSIISYGMDSNLFMGWIGYRFGKS